MYSSLTVIALGTWLTLASESIEPKWMSSYTEALREAKNLERPLVVVIGAGRQGWHQVSTDGELDAAVQRILARQYVCVYLDTEKKTDRRLAAAFEIPKGPGIVISAASGTIQAFRHHGEIDNNELAEYLRRYADPDITVETTETLRQGGEDTDSASDGSSAPQSGRC
jgi:hypothetical protein